MLTAWIEDKKRIERVQPSGGNDTTTRNMLKKLLKELEKLECPPPIDNIRQINSRQRIIRPIKASTRQRNNKASAPHQALMLGRERICGIPSTPRASDGDFEEELRREDVVFDIWVRDIDGVGCEGAATGSIWKWEATSETLSHYIDENQDKGYMNLWVWHLGGMRFGFEVLGFGLLRFELVLSKVLLNVLNGVHGELKSEERVGRQMGCIEGSDRKSDSRS
ncbi:hypothetical protein NC651_012072 [Populus alba x Populus x berolinensis]|nr:hypothetical protein NC651_012072 [Populus alba x Populus x berolinensis]